MSQGSYSPGFFFPPAEPPGEFPAGPLPSPSPRPSLDPCYEYPPAFPPSQPATFSPTPAQSQHFTQVTKPHCCEGSKSL